MKKPGNPEEAKQYKHTFWTFFQFFLGCGIISLLTFVAPFIVGIYVGHAWGLGIAIVNTCGYIWIGLRQPMAPSTRIIWWLGVAFMLFVAGFEFAQLRR